MKIVITLLAFFGMSMSFSQSYGQCTWSSYDFESFEYTTTIPHMIPGMCYQSNPQTFTGCVRTGSRGMYMNIVNGLSGLIYSRPYSTLCIGKQYRFSFSVRDAFNSVGNITINVYDDNNILLQTQTIATNSIWQDISMPAFVMPTASIRFEIVTNVPGGPGNDVGFDDLRLSSCNHPIFNATNAQCFNGTTQNLYSLISGSTLSQNGIWSGPSSLQNGALGTFDQNIHLNGTYIYTVSGDENCPDSIANVSVMVVQTPSIAPISPLSGCSSVVLPTIIGSNLSGQQKYYTQPNGGGTAYVEGSTITTSQTLYAYDGLPGCADQEVVDITIFTPVNAGADNTASYCGPEQVINLNSFLSNSATVGGIWAETTFPSSGGLNANSGSWNSSIAAPGNYTFTYTIPANGLCPADVANFMINIGDMQQVNLGNDTTLCNGQTMWLNAGTYQSYLWNNGSTNATKFVNSPGTYSVRVGTVGANQVVNGNFEMGAVGFTTSYVLGVGGTWGQLSNAGTYAVSTSPNLVHNNFTNCLDATPGAGVNMLIVNGASSPNTPVWCQTIPVQPNTNYQFGASAATAVNESTLAQLQFSINSAALGSVFSPLSTAGVWSQFNQNWYSGMSTTAQICIVNQNINSSGNDFMLDEITFKPVCYKYDTIIVSYAPNPIVNLGPDQNLCSTMTANFDAGNPGENYLWNNGATTQTIQPTTGGNYSVIVTTQNGCTASDAILLTVENQQNAGADSVVQLCSTENYYALSTLLQSSVSTGGVWSSSDFYGNYTPSGDVSLTGTIGTYHFSYKVAGVYCPNDTSEMTMNIVEQPEAAPPVTLHLCNELNSVQDLSVYMNQPVQPNGAYWSFDTAMNPAVFDTNAALLQTGELTHGQYYLDYVLMAESPCIQDTFHIAIQITQVPEVSFTSDVNAGCQPLMVVFENTSNTLGNVEYFWDFGNGDASTTANGNIVEFQDAQCYDVSLTITADDLCSATVTTIDMICAHALPIADFNFGPQQVFSDGPTVEFENTSTGNTFNYWSFGDGATSNVVNPIHDFPLGEIATYTTNLIVESEHGCLDSISKIIEVKDQLLYYVPNSFTPDDNKFNNVFVPVLTAGFDHYGYNLEIYNRWGEMIFYSTDYSFGWDGTVNGQMAQDGTYTWKIIVKLLDNSENMEIVGSVTLIR